QRQRESVRRHVGRQTIRLVWIRCFSGDAVDESVRIELLRQAGELGIIQKVLYAFEQICAALVEQSGDAFIYGSADETEKKINKDYPNRDFEYAGTKHVLSPESELPEAVIKASSDIRSAPTYQRR